MCVNADRGLVLDQVPRRLAVTVVHLAFRGDGDVLVRAAQKLRALGREEGRVRYDDRCVAVENPGSLERLGVVPVWREKVSTHTCIHTTRCQSG